jgi:hypothetical protein
MQKFHMLYTYNISIVVVNLSQTSEQSRLVYLLDDFVNLIHEYEYKFIYSQTCLQEWAHY